MPKTPSVNVRLLKTIKRFPELYNSEHDLANDKAHGLVVWETISYELDTPVGVLKKKWQNLKCSHKRRSRKLKSSKSGGALPNDDVFHLMYSMLDAPGGDSPGDRDDVSLRSAPTLSIISEEDRSTRSSSTSTIVSEFRSAESSGELIAGKNASTKVQRPRHPGSPEAAEDHREDARSEDSTPEDASISPASPEARERSFRRSTRHRNNEPVRAFFESMALTVSKFPQHIQATTKTKICNVVVKAELELSRPAIR